jgi:hypothetical protein
MLHNVTERHLKPYAQLAVQVMSSTVPAALDTHVTAGKEKYFQKAHYMNRLVILFKIHSYFIKIK